MSERRITKNDVRSVFVNFCHAARRAGFDTAGWTLLHPEMKGDVYRLYVERWSGVKRLEDTPFPSHLYATDRETYQQISAWIQCLTAIRNNQQEQGGN